MNIRQQILKEMQEIVETSTQFTARLSRVAPRVQSFPAVSIFADNEEINTISNMFPRTQERRVKIVVQVWVDASNEEQVELDFNTYTQEIEDAMLIPSSAQDLTLNTIDFMYSEDEADVSAAIMVYTALYITSETLIKE